MPNVMAAQPPKMYISCTSPGDGQISCNVWLACSEQCRAVMKPRCETDWNLLGRPKLANRSQPLVGGSSPYGVDIWRRYCCLTNFFPIVDSCLSCKDIAGHSCTMVFRWRFFCVILCPVFPASRVQHISDLHSKFPLRPHHAVDIQSATAENRRGKEEKER